MSRKRRVFDIDLPEELPEAAPQAETATAERRGPMASAISENAEALQARKSQADAIRAENDALAHEYVALKEQGHVVRQIPLDEIHMYLLVRDRMQHVEDFELEELVTSIRELGLSNPIRVIARPDGTGYELVQGYRRLNAYRALLDEGGGDWGEIPALVLPDVPDIAGLYRRMVDENVIRKDLSFAEMALAAQAYAADPGTEAKDLSDAVAALFQSAPYSKRSYIRSFAYLLDRIGPALHFPAEIPRALGVALARALKDHSNMAERVRAELADLINPAIKDELEILRRFAQMDELDTEPPARAPKSEPKRAGGGRTKTTFHLQSTAGQVKCTAAMGRLEIKVDRDFSAIERARLEAAITSLVDGLA